MPTHIQNRIWEPQQTVVGLGANIHQTKILQTCLDYRLAVYSAGAQRQPKLSSPFAVGFLLGGVCSLFLEASCNSHSVSLGLVQGVSPPPGAVLVLHSLPLEFPLAAAFTEQLLTWTLDDSDGRSEEELDTIPASVLLQVVEILGERVVAADSGLWGGVIQQEFLTQCEMAVHPHRCLKRKGKKW